MRSLLLKLAPMFAIAAGAIQAQTVIQPTVRGWVCDAVNTPCAVYGQPGATQGANGASPTNSIFAGSGRVPNDQGQVFDAGVYRNWFQFAIPKFSNPLVAATLTLPQPNRWNNDTHNYTLYVLSAQPKVFADYKTTTPVGVLTTTGSSIGTIQTLYFNKDGLAAITAAQGGNLVLGGVDDGEALGGYHGDFSGTGPVGVDFPPYPNLDRSSPLTLYTSPWANTHTGFCSTPPTGLTSFVMEHVQDVTTIQSTLNGTILPDFLPRIFSPSWQVRSRLTYNNATKVFADDIYVVPAGAPLPTPSTYDIMGNRFAYVVGLVDNIYFNCTPYSSILMTGRYTDGQPIYGNPTGAPFAFSFGYNVNEPDPNFRFRDLAFISSGLGTTFEAYANGTITLPVPAGNPSRPPSAPTVVLTPSFTAGTNQVFQNPVLIDASQSYDGGGQNVTFQWSSTNTVAFSPNATSGKVQVTLQAGRGDYPITLTVTNDQGQSTKVSFILQLVR